MLEPGMPDRFGVPPRDIAPLSRQNALNVSVPLAHPPRHPSGFRLLSLFNPFHFHRGSLLMFGNALAMGMLGVSLLSLYAQANLAPETLQQTAQGEFPPVAVTLPILLESSAQEPTPVPSAAVPLPKAAFASLMAPLPQSLPKAPPLPTRRMEAVTEDEEQAALETLVDKVRAGMKPEKETLASRHAASPVLSRIVGPARTSIAQLIQPLQDMMVSSPFGWRNGRRPGQCVGPFARPGRPKPAAASSGRSAWSARRRGR